MSFAVPTGNFGDVLAGYYARRMGLPIERLVVATNENDILDAVLAGREATRKDIAVRATHSHPSMDIQVSSNFERLLFDASRSGQLTSVRRLMGRPARNRGNSTVAGERALARHSG